MENTLAESREAQFRRLTTTTFDTLVIGGGITGAGIAWQLSRWGIQVALVEQGDYASGTSSRSSKLIHGGFRYLPHGEIRLVRQVSRERSRLFHLMPHLIRPLPMTIPAYDDGPFSLRTLSFGAWVYDHLSHIEHPLSHHRLSRDDVFHRTPGITIDHLRGGISYFEFSGHDARINWQVIKTAKSLGALAINYVHANLTKSNLRPEGLSEVVIEDQLTGQVGTVRARVVVNAAGPWASVVDPEEHLVHSRGIHLVFSRARFPLTHATILPTADNANIFAIPRGPVTYLGTTDQRDQGPLDVPALPVKDATYLLDIANRVFPQTLLRLQDIIAAWSGVRPLIAQDKDIKTDRLSRRDMILAKPSMVTVLGGKFTGFRATAEEVAETVLRRLGGTGRTPVPEAIQDAPHANELSQLRTRIINTYHIASQLADTLIERYGEASQDFLQWIEDEHLDHTPIMDGVPLLIAEVNWAMLKEQALTVGDILIRRTGLAWLGGLTPEVLRQVAVRTIAEMRLRLDWDGVESERQLAQFSTTAYLEDVLRFHQATHP